MNEIHYILDNHISSYVNQGTFSGSILVVKDDQILLSKGYGMANYELDVPNSPTTVFRIGSLTKQFTSFSIMQLYEQKLVKLEDPLNKFIPDYPLGEKVTIHHLLSHTSGIFNYTQLRNFPVISKKYQSVDDLILYIKDIPYEFQPGESINYTNSGYILLGKIIEIVSGKSYEDYLKEEIFEPLEMHSSGYDHNGTIVKLRASGYDLDESGTLKNADYINMSVPFAAGGLYSTVEDLYKWDQALYNNDLLTNESINKMFVCGYGWNYSERERNIVHHMGAIPGFVSMIIRNIENHATIIILSNRFTDISSLGWELAKLIEQK